MARPRKAAAKKKTKDAQEFSFPTKSRCPRCGGMQTNATTTREGKQYRTCASAVCRNRYCVAGTPV